MTMSVLLRIDETGWYRTVGFSNYAWFFSQLVESVRDAIEALTLFRDLTLPTEVLGAPPKGLWLNFDAHPGDCACQIRIAGLHFFARAFQLHPREAQERVQSCLDRLQEVEAKALDTFHQLCTRNTAPGKIGNGLNPKSMTTKDLCYAFGVEDWFEKIATEDFWIVDPPLDLKPRNDGVDWETDVGSATSASSSDTVLVDSDNKPSPQSPYSENETPDKSSDVEGNKKRDIPPVSSAVPSCKETVAYGVTSPLEPLVRFQSNCWNFALRWIIVCYSLGHFHQLEVSNDGESLGYRISVQVNRHDVIFLRRLSCIKLIISEHNTRCAVSLLHLPLTGTHRGAEEEGRLILKLWIPQGLSSVPTSKKSTPSRIASNCRNRTTAKVQCRSPGHR